MSAKRSPRNLDDPNALFETRPKRPATADAKRPVASTRDAGSPSPTSEPQQHFRDRERRAPPLLFPTVLLLVACPFASVLVTRLANAPVLDTRHWLPLGVFTAALLLIGTVLRLGRYRGDGPLVGIVMALCGMGIVVQVRIGTLQFEQFNSPAQIAFPLGIAAMLLTWMICRNGRHRKLESAWLACLLIALAVIGAVVVFGRKYRGATYLRGNVNPVDMIKPLLVVFLAAILVGNRHPLRRRFLGIPIPPLNVVVTVALLWAAPMALLLAQGDLGLITLMNAVALIMLYSVTHRTGYLLGGGAAVVLLARFAVPLSSHAQRRFTAWSDPFTAATGSGWQILQGLVALYSGGLLGTGIGGGAPQVVPIVESDFVYVVFGEELGFVGCALLLLMYLTLAARGFGLAARARSEFSALLATGLTACIVIQTLLNVGGVTKAIPLTGITLPFISHGGSSLVTMLTMVGLLMAISEPERAQTE